MQNVQIDDFSRNYFENYEAEKNSRLSSYTIIFQNIICVAYAIAILCVVLTSFFLANRPTNFFDLMLKICLIPAILMPASRAGILKKITVKEFLSGEFNKKLTEFYCRSSIIIYIITGVSLIVAMLHGEYNISNDLIISIITMVPYVFSVVATRLKTYNWRDEKYLNFVQGFAFLALIGSTIFLLSMFLPIFSENINNWFTNGQLDINDIRLLDWIFLLFEVGGYICTLRNLYRLACIDHNEFFDLFGITASASTMFFGVLSLLVAWFEKEEGYYIPIALMLFGMLIILIVEMFFYEIEKKKFSEMSLANRKDIVTGKVLGYPEIIVNFEELKVKKWEWEWILGFFSLLTVFHAAIDILGGFVISQVAMKAVETTSFLENIFDEAGILNSGTTSAADNNWGAIIMIVGLVMALLLILFVMAIISLNGYREIKRERNVFEVEKVHWSMWAIMPFIVIPAFMAILSIFVPHHAKFMIYMFLIQFIYMYIYYHFGLFLFSTVRCDKLISVFGPTVMFVICEGLTLKIEELVLNIFDFDFAIFNIWDMGLGISNKLSGFAIATLLPEPLMAQIDIVGATKLLTFVLLGCICASGIIYQATKRKILSILFTLPLTNLILVDLYWIPALTIPTIIYAVALILFVVICIIRMFRKNEKEIYLNNSN